MNAIAALGYKIDDLYKISFEEFLEQNPEYKNESEEIQHKRYDLLEEEREKKIIRCKEKRKEIIAASKKIEPLLKKNWSYEGHPKDEVFDLDLDYYDLAQKYKIRKKDENYNYLFRKNNSPKKQKFIPKNKILITDRSYIYNNSNGGQTEITKEDLKNVTCIKDQMKDLRKKIEKKDDHLMRYLKMELDRTQKINSLREKMNEKDENLQKFIKIKNYGTKQMECGRYKDNQNVHERQQIYEKMLSNYGQKISLTKQQQQLERNKSSMELKNESKQKIEELNRQINDYERKNYEYKQKISKLFDLKDRDEMENIIKERNEQKELIENTKVRIPSSILIQKKLKDLKEKNEIEKYRRENALMISMNKFQDKINSYLEKNEEKEKKIKLTLLKNELEIEKTKLKKQNHLNKVKTNIKNNEIINEVKRQQLLEDIENNNLKDFAIKKEKQRIAQERIKLNKINEEERKALKLKIQEIIDGENNYAEGEKNEELIKKMVISGNNDQNNK